MLGGWAIAHTQNDVSFPVAPDDGLVQLWPSQSRQLSPWPPSPISRVLLSPSVTSRKAEPKPRSNIPIAFRGTWEALLHQILCAPLFSK